jgi:hypothetical protein
VPFLRVIRDKRGYETTYLMHLYRDGQRQRSKILYVFRTPGGVRVGRDPLEPDVLRQLEAQYPDIAFNWQMVRDSQQVIETAAEPRRRKPRREEETAGASSETMAVAPTPPPAVTPAAAPANALPTTAAPPRHAIPSTIEGATPDERIAFLAHWHPIIRERIPHRTSDASRQEALNALADRLNPANWTDADQITAGLQQATEALERLSRVFAKRRRRGRRRSDARPAPSQPGPDSTPSES